MTEAQKRLRDELEAIAEDPKKEHKRKNKKIDLKNVEVYQ